MRYKIIKQLMVLFVCSYVSVNANQVHSFSLDNPEKIGAGVNLGASYDPVPTFSFAQLNVFALYDYEQIFPHKAPDQLKFKFEGNLGAATLNETRLLTSLNFYAVYYLDKISNARFRPYVEGGAGIIYSDFQVDGQGLRWNFNPQAGIGFEWQDLSGNRWYSAIHIHHISNGGIHEDNRGINSIMFQFGHLF